MSTRSAPRNQPGCTGRDCFIVAKSLAYAIEMIENLPEKWQERSDKEDMKRLLWVLTDGDSERFRLGARSHLERRGLRIVGDQLALGERENNVVELAVVVRDEARP
jgi:hypothetical protein